MNRTASHAPPFRTRIPLGRGRRAVLWSAVVVASLLTFGLLGSRFLPDALPSGGQGDERMPENGGRPGSAGASADPSVEPHALAPGSRLAFVWNGRLYVLDAGTRSLKLLARRGAGSPALSSDGTWIAHLEGGGLWIRSADGHAAEQIVDLPSELGAFAWSPASNVLAVISGGPEGEGGQVWLVRPGERSRRIVTAPRRISHLAWRPDGRALAYAGALPVEAGGPGAGGEGAGRQTDALFTLEMEAAAPEKVFVARNEGIELSGWWPDGRGLLFWRNPEHSASLAADGLDLYSLRLDGGVARKLATTLPYPEWISWAPDGRRVLLVEGAGRENSDGKSLAVCDVSSGACTALGQPPGTVSLDPAWSPSGARISFVRADRREGLAGPWDPWVRTRKLWTAAPDGTRSHEMATKRAVFGPAWSRDARRILFLGDGALWLADPGGESAPVKVVSPFPGRSGNVAGDGGFYYGFFSPGNLYSWWQG